MPPKKSSLSLIELCWRTVLQNFYYIKGQAELLPRTLTTELFSRCCGHFFPGYASNSGYRVDGNFRLPATLFIRPTTTELYMLDFFDMSEDDVFKKICQICKRLRKIKTKFRIVEITANNPHIIYLDLSQSLVTNDNLATIAKHCPQVKKLSLLACNNITDEGMKNLPQNITHLALDSSGISTKGFITALNLLQSLKELSKPNWSDVLKLLKRENCVKKFTIEKMDFSTFEDSDFHFFNAAFDLFPNLQEIQIFISRRNIPNIATWIGSINHNITRVILFDFSVDAIRLVDYFCPMLKELAIYLTDDSNEVHPITDIIIEHISFKHLRTLFINIGDFNLVRADFLILLENCHQLEVLQIYEFNHLSDQLIIDLIRISPLQHLKCLSLHSCDLLTIESLIEILKFLPSLKQFEIENCEKISESEIAILQASIKQNNWDVTFTDVFSEAIPFKLNPWADI